MASRTHRYKGARVEVGTIAHAGRKFSALGSVVDPARGVLVGYVTKRKDPQPGQTLYVLTSWDGKRELADIHLTSTWKTPQSNWSSTQSSWWAVVDGQRYVGRGAGENMLLKMRAVGKR